MVTVRTFSSQLSGYIGLGYVVHKTNVSRQSKGIMRYIFDNERAYVLPTLSRIIVNCREITVSLSETKLK